tara:strand:- start:160 stop:636 length:477 start_codon:yes stop_codon:yes gene_type:complete
MKIKNYEVIDNFLEDKLCDHLFNLINKDNFPWYVNKINNKDCNKYFSHILFKHYWSSPYLDNFFPLLDAMNMKALIRIKINFYPKTNVIEKHAEHKDYSYNHKAAIFSLNTCKGGTYVQNSFIESKKNRLLKFDGSLNHCSTSTNDKNGRININFNYF